MYQKDIDAKGPKGCKYMNQSIWEKKKLFLKVKCQWNKSERNDVNRE